MSLTDDIFERCMPEPNSGCWLWLGPITRHGYAILSQGRGKGNLAHRISYERHKGPIRAGMTIDHTCQVKSCVNPDHLEVVSGRQNTYRNAARRMFCKNGHLRTYENITTREIHHGTKCLLCQRESQRRYCARKTAA